MLAAAILVAAGCGGERAAGGADSGAGADSSFKVALLTPGPISDQSWNGGAYAGLLRIRDSLGAYISHIQTKTPAEFEENFRQYGAQGYDLVFGHGFEFQDAAVRVAPQYPHTLYITTSGNQVRDNVAGMTFSFEEASYLAGMVAAGVTRSGVIGVLGGTELPPVKASFDAFALGARAVRPDVRVVTSYIGNWEDVGAGKEQALAQIGRGVDVIFQNADAAGLGVFQAAREHPGVLVIGSNANQNGVAPEVTLGSVVIDLPHALLTVARQVKAGQFQPRVVALGTADRVVDWVPNPQLADRVPVALRQRVDSLQATMQAGTFAMPELDYAFDRPASPAAPDSEHPDPR
ncbi:MAG TPA: BMP family protein [Gemmatimonadaceae bacterium]|nr:BMP family protein [Gemmatimonadaceae bacterium]